MHSVRLKIKKSPINECAAGCSKGKDCNDGKEILEKSHKTNEMPDNVDGVEENSCGNDSNVRDGNDDDSSFDDHDESLYDDNEDQSTFSVDCIFSFFLYI